MQRSITIAGLLLVAAAAGCQSNPLQQSAQERQSLRQVKDSRIANAPDEPAPSILPQTHFAAGRMFEAQNDLQRAAQQYQKAIVLNHNAIAAYHRLALAQSRLGLHEEAVKTLRKAVAVRPEEATLHNNLGFELMFLERWTEAEVVLRKAIELQPSFARAQVNLAMLMSRLHRFDEALAMFKAALGDPDAYYNMGLMYRGQRRFVDARRSFEQVLVTKPNSKAAQGQLEELAPLIEDELANRSTPPAPTPNAGWVAPVIDQPTAESEETRHVARPTKQRAPVTADVLTTSRNSGPATPTSATAMTVVEAQAPCEAPTWATADQPANEAVTIATAPSAHEAAPYKLEILTPGGEMVRWTGEPAAPLQGTDYFGPAPESGEAAIAPQAHPTVQPAQPMLVKDRPEPQKEQPKGKPITDARDQADDMAAPREGMRLWQQHFDGLEDLGAIVWNEILCLDDERSARADRFGNGVTMWQFTDFIEAEPCDSAQFTDADGRQPETSDAGRDVAGAAKLFEASPR